MSTPAGDRRLEAELRAMLQRRAQDIDPEPPPWRELAQRNGAVVISLRTGDRIEADAASIRRHRLLGRQWLRPVLAATVALVVAIAGAVVVRGAAPGKNDTADGPETIDVPSAGQRGFDPARATPLYPLTDDKSAAALPQDEWLSDAQDTAERYLREVGLPVDQDAVLVDPPTNESHSGASADDEPVETAMVAWSSHPLHMPEQPAMASGNVFLRNASLGGRDTWFVVGVMTNTLWLTDIRRDGDELTFTVDRTTETETFQKEDALVSVDGRLVGSAEWGKIRHFVVPSPSGLAAVIAVQNTDGGVPMSVTSTAVPAIPGGSMRQPERRAVEPSTGKGSVLVPGEDGSVEGQVGVTGPLVVVPERAPASEEIDVDVPPSERRVAVSRR